MSSHHLVVNCKHAPFDVYIGRDCKSAPKGVQYIWGNPFVMKNQSAGERKRVHGAYNEWIHSQPDLIAKAKIELKGKVLGCHCSPKDCHGHVLAEIANSEDNIGIMNEAKGSLATAIGTTSKTSKSTTTTTGVITTKSRNTTTITIKTSEKTPTTSGTNSAKTPLTSAGAVSKKNPSTTTSTTSATTASSSSTTEKEERVLSPLVDIGINLHNKQMLKTWHQQVQRASEANVTTILLTGTSLHNSSQSLTAAETFMSEKPDEMDMSLYCTVGIHPHDAKTFQGTKTLQALQTLLQHPLAVAVVSKSSHHMTSHHITSHDITSHHITSHHITSHDIT